MNRADITPGQQLECLFSNSKYSWWVPCVVVKVNRKLVCVDAEVMRGDVRRLTVNPDCLRLPIAKELRFKDTDDYKDIFLQGYAACLSGFAQDDNPHYETGSNWDYLHAWFAGYCAAKWPQFHPTPAWLNMSLTAQEQEQSG